MEIAKTWSELKALYTVKQLSFQYNLKSTYYYVFIIEDGIIYHTDIGISDPRSADQIDFEDNYKAISNKPIFSGEDNILDALAIRDTSDHFSGVSDGRGFVPKTIVIYNNTDQTATVQVQGDRDAEFDVAMNIGGAVTINSLVHDYVTLNDYLPFLRVKVNFSVAPTTGTVSAWLLKVRA